MDFVGSVIGGAVEVATGKGGALVTTIITISLCPDLKLLYHQRFFFTGKGGALVTTIITISLHKRS